MLQTGEYNNIHIERSQYHDYWWPNDEWSQGINSHGIELVCPKYSGLKMRGVEIYKVMEAWVVCISDLLCVPGLIQYAWNQQPIVQAWSLITNRGLIQYKDAILPV